MCWMCITTGETPADAVDRAAAALRPHEQTNGHSWGLGVAPSSSSADGTDAPGPGPLVASTGVGHLPAETPDLSADGSAATGAATGEATGAATDADAAGGSPAVALGHTRFATRGAITSANAHPFPVYATLEMAAAGVDPAVEVSRPAGELDGAVALLAHNGTWREAPDDGRTDSWHIARLLTATLDAVALDEAGAGAVFEWALAAVAAYVGETLVCLHRDGRAWVYAGRYPITELPDGSVASSGGDPLTPGTLYRISPDGDGCSVAPTTATSESTAYAIVRDADVALRTADA